MTTRNFAAAAFAAAVIATPAMAQDKDGGDTRTRVTPYIELSQVLTDDLQTGDVLTYSSAAVGIDATTQTQRLTASISARYEHQFTYRKNESDADLISGAAQVSAQVARGVSIDAGALATRTRSDIRGAAPVFFGNDDSNISKVYSGYIGPTIASGTGPIFINAAYRYGYTKVTTPGAFSLDPGSPRLDLFDREQTQFGTFSTGWKSGTVTPFGVTVSGGFERDDQNQLDNRFDDVFARGDLVQPVSATVALTAGVGYEKIVSSARDPKLDTNGDPVLDANGRYVTDESSPRRIAYRTDGIYYDAGVLWRPSPRTSLEAHFGRRYGDWGFTGSFIWAPSKGVGVQVGVYDTVTTFGSQLQRGIQNLPDQFTATRDALAQQFAGCTFGTTGGGAAGACLNSAFQSIATATYRVRGVDAVISMERGRNTFGVGFGYTNRHFLAPNGSIVNGVTDQSYYAQVFYSRPIGEHAGFSGDLFFNYYEPGLSSSDIYSFGATGSVYRNIGHLSVTGSVGYYYFDSQGQQTQSTLQALLGGRYSF